MRYNGTTVPTSRDNTYDTGEVVRPDMDRRSDWETSDSEDASFIRNKPVLAQADWNEVDDSAPSFIRNKPDVDFDEILTASESINEQLPEMEELLEEMQETDVAELSAEVTDLKSEINALEDSDFNLQEVSPTHNGYYFGPAGTNWKPASDWSVANRVVVGMNTHVKYKLTTHSDVSSVCFLDSTASVISIAVIGTSTTATQKEGYVKIPSNAVYVNFSFYPANNDSVYLYYTEKEKLDWESNKNNFTDNPKANELIKELYIPNTINYSNVTSILFMRSTFSGNRYKNGFRFYAGNSYTEYARVFATSTEAEADILTRPINYNGIYAVVDWSKVPQGATYSASCSISDICRNLDFSPVIKSELSTYYYINDYNADRVIKELYVPYNRILDNLTSVFIWKAVLNNNYYKTGIIFRSSSRTDYYLMQSPTLEGALSFCKNGIFNVNGVRFIIDWDKMSDGEIISSTESVTLLEPAFTLDCNPAIMSEMNRLKPNNMANPILQTEESWNASHDTLKVIKKIPFNSSNRTGVEWRSPVCIVTNSGAVVVAGCERYGHETDEEQMAISVCANPFDDNPVLTELFNDAGYTYSNPSFVIDRTGVHGTAGRIYLFVYKCVEGISPQNTDASNVDCLYKYSDDDGATWSVAVSLKPAWDSSRYVCGIPAPANGIQASDGTLIVPCMFGGLNSQWLSGLLFKKTNGNWTFSNVTPYIGDNECTVYEDYSGNIVLNCRTYESSLRNVYKYDFANDSFTHIDQNFDAGTPCQMQIITGTADTLDVYLMTYHDASNINSGWERNRNHPTLWVSDDGLRWIRAYRAGTGNREGYTCVTEYNGKRIMAYEDLQDWSITVQDISNISGQLWNTMRTQYNREIEYRLQEVIDKFL